MRMIQLRLAEPQEAKRLWYLRNQALRFGCENVYPSEVLAAWTPDEMPEGYRQAIINNPFYVIDCKEYNIPVASGFLDVKTGFAEAIFTLPEHMGKGFARLILKQLKHEAIKRGQSRLFLDATPNAVLFYLKQGFKALEERDYYSDLAKAKLHCYRMFIDLD
ncbi:GNAT family N-acetyltransferase [Proteus sp. ZN5]|uniref:GNAT family N-acetyltransferase n=1 Tax=Proteus sp. ZN5 TaxID=2697019 RepID=UPI0013E18D9F|nr:GNAT family N-acetyltransferase [Proteus sp. ZN5]QIG07514.1 GNAT family N-acetyltransferase [Proteus sp. ZN5]